VTIATLSLRRVSMFSLPDAAASSQPMSKSYGADGAGGEVSSRKHDTSLSWTSGDYQSEVLGHSGKRRGRTLERPVRPAQRPSAIAAAVIFVEAWTMVVFPRAGCI
jgi:hypothetical protein